jgi:hypothetical protein
MRTKSSLENMEDRDHTEELDVDGRIILKFTLNMEGRFRLDSSGLG